MPARDGVPRQGLSVAVAVGPPAGCSEARSDLGRRPAGTLLLSDQHFHGLVMMRPEPLGLLLAFVPRLSPGSRRCVVQLEQSVDQALVDRIGDTAEGFLEVHS